MQAVGFKFELLLHLTTETTVAQANEERMSTWLGEKQLCRKI